MFRVLKRTVSLRLRLSTQNICFGGEIRKIIFSLGPLVFNSFLASGDFCCLLITFASSLDPDQDQQIVGPDLDPNFLTL